MLLTSIGLVLLVAACGGPDVEKAGAGSVNTANTAAPGSMDSTHAVNAGPQTIELTQGTNLSFAIDDSRELIVLALQGRLFRMSLSGGKAEALFTEAFDAREPAFDPVSGEVVFQGYRSGTWDLFRVPIEGGVPAAITDDPFDDREPHVNPAGDVVFASDRTPAGPHGREGGYNIWIRRGADGALQRLTEGSGNAHSPAWSPDGSQVAYAVDGTVEGSVDGAIGGVLHVRDLVDGEDRILTTESGVISGIAWSTDGLQLSYQLLARDAEGVPTTSLRVIDFVGGKPSVITPAGADVFPFRAAWLPEGDVVVGMDGRIKRLTLSADKPKSASGMRTSRSTDIPFRVAVTLDRKPYTPRRRNHDDLSERPALGIVSPALSSDGTRVTFTALGNVWLWTPGTAGLVQVTDDESAEQNPLFMPDGKSLLFVSDRDGPQKLIVRDLTTGSETLLSVPGATSLSFPAISPDGSRIAVFRDVAGSPLSGQLTILDPVTGATTDVGKPMPPQPVSFAPDGSRLLTARLRPYSSRYREGLYELVLFDTRAGQERTIIPVNHRSVLEASLAPDGRSVFWTGDGLLWRLELKADGSPVEKPVSVTSELTDQPAFSADGRIAVYSSGAQLKRLDLMSGAVTDITPPLRWKPHVPEGRWVLRAGRVYDGRLDGYRSDIDIVINGQRIETLEPVRTDRPERVVDASDHTVIPGLFEMHAHMGNTSGRQGRAWLAWGITNVRDPGSQPFIARERKEAWDSGIRPGPRTYVTGYLTDGNRVYYAMAEGISGDDHLERSLQRARSLDYDFIKTYVRLPDVLQAEVVAFAHANGIPVSSHELFPAVATGVDHVEHVGGTSRRGYQPKVSALGRSYGDVEELLVKGGMGITPTLVLPGFAVIAADEPDLFETPQFRTFYGDSMLRTMRAAMPVSVNGARAIAAANGDLVKRLVARDALVVTGTDAPFVPYAAGLHAELRLYARAGLTPTQILHAATWKSAIAARVEHDLGSIEVGKLADLVVIDGDPLARIEDADNVVLTVKGGQAWTQQELGVVPPETENPVPAANTAANGDEEGDERGVEQGDEEGSGEESGDDAPS